ncbi:MAG: thiamine-phosphate kinase [Alistipes sp.]|nr:thiamine-phosphate kinase [Alistipes sp.]
MELSELGEFGWIDTIRRRFASIPVGANQGIGDDCAVLPLAEGQAWVVTTDMLVEGVHFLPDRITPYQLGRKSLAVNLSDVAAMGATPVASFLSVALPHSYTVEWADGFLAGYHALSEAFGVPLLGGDTTAGDRLTINVTAMGKAPLAHLKYRRSACVGDRIFVTGVLGGSAQGLCDLQAGHVDTPYVALHHDPQPQVREGIWLGQQPAVRAMMDLSDGLASDLVHILRASGCGAVIALEQIPAATSVELAVTGGEDYQLLLTLDARDASEVAQQYRNQFGKPLYEIGVIRQGAPQIEWQERGVPITPDWRGFTHF